MRPANKVFFNTGISYVRSFLTVGVNLYTTRLVLQALGSQDFGIYQLIGGVVAALAFLNNAMATSTQRYLSYHQGGKNLLMQRVIFGNSLLIHLAIGMVVLVVLQIASGYVFGGMLNIPAERIGATWQVYHFMALSVFASVLSVPFIGSLVAHENMAWTVAVSIFEVLAKLTLALILVRFSGDKLVLFGLCSAAISIANLLVHAIYCIKKYPECSFDTVRLFQKKRAQELLSYAGWNLFGTLCGILRTQGLAILLNISHGARINAAYGIANQVSGQVNFFSSTLLRAMNPQIMKSEGANNRRRVLRLSMMTSKFCFFLLAVVAIPAIFNMDKILAFWLAEVPQYTGVFCQFILLTILINQTTVGLHSAIQATGKIRVYQITVGSILLLNLPASYLLLKMDFPIYFTVISFSAIEAIACVARLFISRSTARLSIREYARKVFMREVIAVTSSIAICYYFSAAAQNLWELALLFAVSTITFVTAVYFTGLCDDEKVLIHNLFLQIRRKIPVLSASK